MARVIDPTHHFERLAAGSFTRSVGAAYLAHLERLLKVKAQPVKRVQ